MDLKVGSIMPSIPPKPVTSDPDYKPSPEPSQIANVDQLKKFEFPGQQIPVSEEQLIRAIDRALKAMSGSNTYLHFSVHSQTKTIMVKIMEQGTDRVIREVPPEKMLDFVAKLWEMTGILIDEKR